MFNEFQDKLDSFLASKSLVLLNSRHSYDMLYDFRTKELLSVGLHLKSLPSAQSEAKSKLHEAERELGTLKSKKRAGVNRVTLKAALGKATPEDTEAMATGIAA